MKMRLRMMLVRAPFVIVVFSVTAYITLAKSEFKEPPAVGLARWRKTATTTGSPGQNLEGKMFTLSRNGGGITFYSSYYPTPRPYPTRPYPTRPYPTRYYPSSRPYPTQPYPTRYYPTIPPWTTAPTVTGVSVCLRYLTDSRSIQQFFRLGSASSYSLYLDLLNMDTYMLRFNNQYNSLVLQPNKMFGEPTSGLWTSVCFTVDNRKKVAQVFSGSKMSIRKFMPAQLFWSGEPVIEFSSFDGQLTDVQVWDYPISYKDVSSYMDNRYEPQRGSILTWSSINYSLRGNALLEDSFEKQRSEVGRKRTQKKFLHAQKRQGGKKWQL